MSWYDYDARRMGSENNREQRRGREKFDAHHQRVSSPSLTSAPTASSLTAGPNSNTKTISGGNDLPRNSQNGSGNAQSGKNSGNTRRKLPQRELDQLRAQNRCFECKLEGHISKDCPKRRRLNVGNAGKNSLRVLAVLMTSTCILHPETSSLLELALIPVEEWIPSESYLEARDQVLIERALSVLRGAIPFVYDFFTVESNSPFSLTRFTMSGYGGDIFLIEDWYDG